MKKLSTIALSIFVAVAVLLVSNPAEAAISSLSNISVSSSNTAASATSTYTVNFTLDNDITSDEAVMFAFTQVGNNLDSVMESGFNFFSASIAESSDISGTIATGWGDPTPLLFVELDAGLAAGNYSLVVDGAINTSTSGCYTTFMTTDPMPGELSTFYQADNSFTVGDAIGCDDQVEEGIDFDLLADIAPYNTTVVGDLVRMYWFSGITDFSAYHIYVGDSESANRERITNEEAADVVVNDSDIRAISLVGLTTGATQVVTIVAVDAEGAPLAIGDESVTLGNETYEGTRAPQPVIPRKSLVDLSLKVDKLYHRNVVPSKKVISVHLDNNDKTKLAQVVMSNGEKQYRNFTLDAMYAESTVVARQRLVIENVYDVTTGEPRKVKSLWSEYSNPKTLNAGNFKYGGPRLASLEEEYQNSVAFRDAVEARINRTLRIDSGWFVDLFNAYQYGGYNIDDIVIEVESGPCRVHTVIPKSAWKHTSNYKNCGQ